MMNMGVAAISLRSASVRLGALALISRFPNSKPVDKRLLWTMVPCWCLTVVNDIV
jgi:hypothetical protein